MMGWRPGQRAQQRALEAPYEDVPEHLAQPLWIWVQECFYTPYSTRSERFSEVAIQLRISLPVEHSMAQRELARRANENAGFVLDVVEAMLELYGWDQGRAEELETLLAAANSLYAVRADREGLELRVLPEVKDAVQAVVDSAPGSAGDHLRTAWNEAYSRSPDPVKAYAESIKAVESAMAPVVSPTNLRATLGTIIRDVENKPSKWLFDIADGRVGGVESVLALMQLLWGGQSSRHGGIKPTRAETPAEARAAVHLAATLVQFAVGGSFRAR